MAISADLGAQLEDFVNQLVSKGRYNSKSEVLREGVRLVQEREARLAALDAAIARGIADADAGRVMPAEEAFARLESKYAEWDAQEQAVEQEEELPGQRDFMRSLVASFGRNRDKICAAYAQAEINGQVRRKNNTADISPDQYALALWRDGERKGWM